MLTNAPVLIFSAVHEELRVIMDNLKSPIVSNIGGRRLASGKINNIRVHLLVTGPAIVNTVQALTAAIEHERPGLMINTGCAGAFKKSGLEIGDIGIGTQETDIHLGIEPENKNRVIAPLPFAILSANNMNIKNSYPVNPEFVKTTFNILSGAFNPGICRVKAGPFITVSTITATDKKAENLYKQFAPCMESMEGSGAAHLGIHYKIPLIEIRSASNFVGKRDKKTWNLPLAFERCNAAVLELLQNFNEFGEIL